MARLLILSPEKIGFEVKIAIVGGGFGLYGYLPALLQIPNATPILQTRYQERLKARTDISQFYNDIEWVSDDDALLETSEGIIIALPPMEQYMWAKKCLGFKNISLMLLEKPLAPNPILANELLNDLESSGKKFRLGYNFRYTLWGQDILKNAKSIESIVWNFRAHHYTQNVQTWKRQHDDGGGAIRFYGIHLIALLAELGYNDASYSEVNEKQENEIESWDTELVGSGLPPCRISVASNSDNTKFIVRDGNGHVYSLLQPFQTLLTRKDALMDQRIPFLTQGLQDMLSKDQFFYDWYHKTNLLWSNIEKRTLIS
ncbi:MAG: hypothetical protein BGO67_09160 [Alphaproteobacteria bacterium 41-28]|nr:MAG: hypothetical protein BGO67_09160 [Alphaproteobacteria bacterium 41-28]